MIFHLNMVLIFFMHTKILQVFVFINGHFCFFKVHLIINECTIMNFLKYNI